MSGGDTAFHPYEEYNSDASDADVIQVAGNLEADMERLEKAKEIERQKQREAEKARRARAARRSVGFVDGDDDTFNTTFNAGSGDDASNMSTRNRDGMGGAAGKSHDASAKTK